MTKPLNGTPFAPQPDSPRTRPVFVDNRDGNTLARAITSHLAALRRDGRAPAERARFLVEEVERIGAEPFHAPEPLPPIEMDEIHLITWMAIEPEAAEGAG